MKCRIILHLIFLIFYWSSAIGSASSANARKPGWRTEFTSLNVEINPATGKLNGNAMLTLVNSDNVKGEIPLILNRELKVLSVTDKNGQPLSYERDNGTLKVMCAGQNCKKDTFNLIVSYEGSFTDRVPELDFLEAWIGPDISYALYTSCWYPVVTGTDFRSRGKIIYHIPIGWTVASSGKLSEEKQMGNNCIFIFEINSRVKFSFAAGPFKYLRKSIDDLDVGVYLLNGDKNKVQFYMEKCSRIVKFLTEYYGIFPYEGYSIVEIPRELLGNAGGGSYEGLTFYMPGAFADRVFFAATFGHEIGHIWWGSFIESQDGAVINEGLAQLSMGLWLEHAFGEKVFRSLLKNGAMELQLWQTASLYFKFISPENSDNLLLPGVLHGEDLVLGINRKDKRQTLHTLANSKGFFIYFMLRDAIGPEAFRDGLRNVMTRFSWRSDLTLNDLRVEFEKSSGQNLKWFFDQWFFRQGAPEFILSYDIKAVEGNFQISGIINQVREVYRVNAVIGLVKGESQETRNVAIRNRKTAFSFLLSYMPDTVLFDPDYRILRWTEEFKNQERSK
jgi:hypothetical protein